MASTTKKIAGYFQRMNPFAKSLTRMPFPAQGYSSSNFLLPNTQRNYAATVGDGLSSAIVLAAIAWVGRNFPEAPVMVEQLKAKKWSKLENHEVEVLLDTPNPFYSGELMLAAASMDYTLNGNAYLIKLRNKLDEPVQLWWVPSALMEPKGTEQEFITHYEYNLPGSRKPVEFEPRNVIHFRFGLDTKNPRKGISLFHALLREIFTDNEAANFAASVLSNLGVPGVIIAPKATSFDNSDYAGDADAETMRRVFKEKFGGDRRGEPMILTAPADVEVLSWSPEQLDLKFLRRVPEERVAAVLGIPAIVLGLGAGLDRTTFTNYKEAREAAYENAIIPMQRIFGAEMRRQLLTDYINPKKLRNFRVKFDLGEVLALREDLDAQYTRLNGAVRTGWMEVYEARDEVGLIAEDKHRFYLRDVRQYAVPSEDPYAVPPTVILQEQAMQMEQERMEQEAARAEEEADNEEEDTEEEPSGQDSEN